MHPFIFIILLWLGLGAENPLKYVTILNPKVDT